MQTQSLHIGKYIYERLKDLCSGGCFAVIADHGAQMPFMVYRRTGLTILENKDSDFVDRVNVEIAIVSADYDESVSLVQKAKDMLNRRRDIFENLCVEKIEIVNASENWANDAYVQRLNLLIKISKIY